MGLFDLFKRRKKNRLEEQNTKEAGTNDILGNQSDMQKTNDTDISDNVAKISPLQPEYTLREMLRKAIELIAEMRECYHHDVLYRRTFFTYQTLQECEILYISFKRYIQKGIFSTGTPEYDALTEICTQVEYLRNEVREKSEHYSHSTLGVIAMPKDDPFTSIYSPEELECLEKWYDHFRGLLNLPKTHDSHSRYSYLYYDLGCFPRTSVHDFVKEVNDPQAVLNMVKETIESKKESLNQLKAKFYEAQGRFDTADDSYLLLTYYPTVLDFPTKEKELYMDLKALNRIARELNLYISAINKSNDSQKNPD